MGVQNKVGPAEYGIFFSLFNLCYLFQIINDLGLNNYNNTTVAKDENLLIQNLPKILGLKLVLSIMFFGVICVIAFLIDYPDEYYPLLWFIAINQILVSFILYLRTNISGLGFYQWDSFLSVLDKLILIFILAYLLWGYPSNDHPAFSISWFVYAQMASLILTLIVVLMLCLSKIKVSSFSFIPSFDISLLKKSLPFALIVLIMSAYTRIDAIMLERILDDGKQEAGIYAAAYRILDSLNILGFLFAGLLLPMFSKMLAKGEDTQPILVLSYQLLMAIAISIALYASCFGNELMMALYPEHSSAYYATILKYLTWGFLGIATTHILGPLLTANHSLKRMNVVFAVGFLINIMLNWFFIPEYKAMAAAATTLVTEVFVAVGLFYVVMHEFKYRVELKPFFNLLVYGLVLFSFYYSTSTLLDLGWLISLILGIIVSFVVSLLLNIIDIGELKAILINR